MNTFFEKNNAFFRKHQPELVSKILPPDKLRNVRFDEKPHPNVLFREKPFHSRRDPKKEAETLVSGLTVRKGYLFIFFGIGLGYHIEHFMRTYRNAKDATVVAIEHSMEAFSILCHRRDVSFLSGILLFVGESAERVNEYFSTLSPLDFKGYRIIRLRGAVSLNAQYYTAIETYFKSSVTGRLSDVLTRFSFESLWMKNIVENIPSLENSVSVAALRNTYRGTPALVIAAGPSLFGQLNRIRALADRVVLIAVDTALKPLLAIDVVPDFIITLDAQYYNMFDFTDILSTPAVSKRISLVADLVSCPKILKSWNGPLFFSATAAKPENSSSLPQDHLPLIDMLGEFIPHITHFDCGGSVATTAIEFALHLGASPVAVTGLDLAYSDYLTHVNSSSPYLFADRGSGRLSPLLTKMLKIIASRKLQAAPGIGGEQVLSDFVFSHYAHWFENKKGYAGKVFNATEKGVRISLLPHIELEEIPSNQKRLKQAANPGAHDSETLGREACLRFLHSLFDRIGAAKKEVTGALEASTEFISRYPFLRNVVVEAKSLYHAAEPFETHIRLFLLLMERKVIQALQRLGENPHP